MIFPVLINKIRKTLYSLKYGKNVIIDGPGIVLSNVKFDYAAFIAHHVEVSNCYIGNHTSVGRYTKIRDSVIGKYCSISWDCTIGAPTHPFNTITSSAITYRKEYELIKEDIYFEQKQTFIGNDVWIGCGCILLSGIKVGNGSIIGAGAVVTKDIPAYEIWGGVPAHKIKSRFDEDIANRLENIEWWDWPVSLQRKFLNLFTQKMDESLITHIEEKYKKLKNDNGDI